MPDLGNAFRQTLPSLSGAVGVASIANYAMADATTLLQEGWQKANSALGVATSFKKAAVIAPLAPASGVTETQASATEINGALQTSGDSIDDTGHKVKLVAPIDGNNTQFANDVNFPRSDLTQYIVEFDIMPSITETHSVDYESLSAAQMPTEFQKYKGTKTIQWTINGTFVCRTRVEAYRNYIFLNNLRGWTKPYFGEKQRLQFGENGNSRLGAPPPVLKFSGWRELVGEVPVVITSLNWTFPKDCDWIPCNVFDSNGKELPFPTVMEVNISIIESFSPDEVNGFDLVAFRNGRMVNAWLPEDAQPRSYDRAEPVSANGGNQSIANGTPQGIQNSAFDSSNLAPKTSTADYFLRSNGIGYGSTGNYNTGINTAFNFGAFPAEISSSIPNISQPEPEV